MAPWIGDHNGNGGGQTVGTAYLVHGPLTGEYRVSEIAAATMVGDTPLGKAGKVAEWRARLPAYLR